VLRWRDSDGENIEPIVKVLPKPTLTDLFLKVSIGRCHDPYIDFDGMGRAQALKLVASPEGDPAGKPNKNVSEHIILGNINGCSCANTLAYYFIGQDWRGL